jgi:uncharacterized protein YegP (UPF0339 family)
MAESKAKFDLYKDTAGEFRWRLIHLPTKNIIADSSEGYQRKRDALNGFRSVMRHGPKALSQHLGKFEATFELFKDRRGEFRWRLRHTNTEILATPGEGFTRKENALKDIESVKRTVQSAPVVDMEDIEEK